MLMILSGDWTTHIHLGIYRPVFDADFDFGFELIPNGGVTLAFQPKGDDGIRMGMAVCSLSDSYSRETGWVLSGRRIYSSSFRAQGDPTYRRDPERGVRTVELDGFVTTSLEAASRAGLLRQFGRLAKSSGVPIILATRAKAHPVWGWMPDGTSGPATFDGMGV
jgi:hypothetical protein